MGKYRHNTNGSTKLVLVKQNFLLRGIRDSRTLIVQVLIGVMHGLVVSILVIRNFALTEFALARLHCILLMHFFKFFYYYVRRSVLFKIHAANIEASKFFCFVFVGDHGKLFLKISQMQVYTYIHIYFVLVNFYFFIKMIQFIL